MANPESKEVMWRSGLEFTQSALVGCYTARGKLSVAPGNPERSRLSHQPGSYVSCRSFESRKLAADRMLPMQPGPPSLGSDPELARERAIQQGTREQVRNWVADYLVSISDEGISAEEFQQRVAATISYGIESFVSSSEYLENSAVHCRQVTLPSSGELPWSFRSPFHPEKGLSDLMRAGIEGLKQQSYSSKCSESLGRSQIVIRPGRNGSFSAGRDQACHEALDPYMRRAREAVEGLDSSRKGQVATGLWAASMQCMSACSSGSTGFVESGPAIVFPDAAGLGTPTAARGALEAAVAQRDLERLAAVVPQLADERHIGELLDAYDHRRAEVQRVSCDRSCDCSSKQGDELDYDTERIAVELCEFFEETLECLEPEGLVSWGPEGARWFYSPRCAGEPAPPKKQGREDKDHGAEEGLVYLDRIRLAEKVYHHEWDMFTSASWSPRDVPGPDAVEFTGGGSESFRLLGWQPVGPVRCIYKVDATESGLGDFHAFAECDIDGDGDPAVYYANRADKAKIIGSEDTQ